MLQHPTVTVSNYRIPLLLTAVFERTFSSFRRTRTHVAPFPLTKQIEFAVYFVLQKQLLLLQQQVEVVGGFMKTYFQTWVNKWKSSLVIHSPIKTIFLECPLLLTSLIVYDATLNESNIVMYGPRYLGVGYGEFDFNDLI